MSKWRCEECDWHGTHDQLLKAPNPFDPANMIYGCPNCKEVNDMMAICDEPGCEQKVSCGFPADDDGYRNTCFDHSQFKQDKDKEKS